MFSLSFSPFPPKVYGVEWMSDWGESTLLIPHVHRLFQSLKLVKQPKQFRRAQLSWWTQVAMMVTLTVALTKEVLIFSQRLSTRLKTNVYYGSSKEDKWLWFANICKDKSLSTVLQLLETSVCHNNNVILNIVARVQYLFFIFFILLI